MMAMIVDCWVSLRSIQPTKSRGCVAFAGWVVERNPTRNDRTDRGNGSENELESDVKLEIHGKRLWLLILVLICWSGWCWSALASPVDIVDDAGQAIHFEQSPKRVVSLVPSATEIIFAIGAEDALRGITYHSASLRGAGKKILVGGFFSPSAERITVLRPTW